VGEGALGRSAPPPPSQQHETRRDQGNAQRPGGQGWGPGLHETPRGSHPPLWGSGPPPFFCLLIPLPILGVSKNPWAKDTREQIGKPWEGGYGGTLFPFPFPFQSAKLFPEETLLITALILLTLCGVSWQGVKPIFCGDTFTVLLRSDELGHMAIHVTIII
jgi:hypothetical protein